MKVQKKFNGKLSSAKLQTTVTTVNRDDYLTARFLLKPFHSLCTFFSDLAVDEPLFGLLADDARKDNRAYGIIALPELQQVVFAILDLTDDYNVGLEEALILDIYKSLYDERGPEVAFEEFHLITDRINYVRAIRNA